MFLSRAWSIANMLLRTARSSGLEQAIVRKIIFMLPEILALPERAAI